MTKKTTRVREKDEMKVHLSVSLYATRETLCGNTDGTIADYDALLLQEGEYWCEDCIQKRKAMRTEPSDLHL